MSEVEKAVECFKNGFSCSQAIVSTYCEQLGIDKETGLKISSGLGGGMGRLGLTCGAVSGAYLLIGLKYGSEKANDKEAKEKTYELIREFAKRFEAINGSTSCKDLLGIDLMTGDKNIISKQVKEVCPKMVHDAALIIEDILNR
ncbi:MAG: C-GCAxxG-C-C family protein [Saccharofermentanales bacterium]